MIKGLRFFLLVGLLSPATLPAAPLSVSVTAEHQAITPNMRTVPIHIGGRTQATALPSPMPKGAMAHSHEWPGIYFEAAFVGDRVFLKFDDRYNQYRLIVDDNAPIIIDQPGNSEFAVNGLKWGKHRLRLEKISESIKVRGTFSGFFVPRNHKPLPFQSRVKQIEFIGPSAMTGYGVNSTKHECSPEEWRKATNVQIGYAALVAKHYDADYQINAISGRGLVRNWKDARTESGLAALYPYMFSDKSVAYTDSNWRPQIIRISGWVDLIAGPIEPEEQWKDHFLLYADWTDALSALVVDLHTRSPQAAILIDWSTAQDLWGMPQYQPNVDAAEATITSVAREAGVRKIVFGDFSIRPTNIPTLEMTACHNHLSVRDNERIAEWMIAYIDAHPDLWGGK
ncbi:hypothetical protein ACFOWX_02560 [Sphingorhabdus arenilitoris]|uniref:Carbohydrate esterase 2 N-terminal domain-containing protein n=1 Tax=Sphingorhabdus arenilitoris TaxID=1490041 RepID=A0ABV8REH4_9SPHN